MNEQAITESHKALNSHRNSHTDKSDEIEVNQLTVTSLSLLVSWWVASSGSDKSSRKFEGTKPRTPRSSPYKAGEKQINTVQARQRKL